MSRAIHFPVVINILAINHVNKIVRTLSLVFFTMTTMFNHVQHNILRCLTYGGSKQKQFMGNLRT